MPHKSKEARNAAARARAAKLKAEDPEWVKRQREKNRQKYLKNLQKGETFKAQRAAEYKRWYENGGKDHKREKNGSLSFEEYQAKLAEGRRKAREYMKVWSASEKGQRARCQRTIYRKFREQGFTIDEYDAMYKAQEGKCAICGEHRPKYGQKRHHIDHCHSTGKVRGLLCPNCNSALGGFRENEEIMKAAAEYVRVHRVSV